MEKLVSRVAHNHEVVGAEPTSATKKTLKSIMVLEKGKKMFTQMWSMTKMTKTTGISSDCIVMSSIVISISDSDSQKETT